MKKKKFSLMPVVSLIGIVSLIRLVNTAGTI
jgi:hypothetical protein